MSSNIDLFPFPGQSDNDEKDQVIEPGLPAFPPPLETDVAPLTKAEISQVRQLLKKFGSEKSAPTKPNPIPPPASFIEPVATGTASSSQAPGSNRDLMLKVFDSAQITEVWEVEARTSFKALLSEIENDSSFVRIFAALAGIFPLRKCLRHGTPEQKMFSAIALSDRFLTGISGEPFAGRKRLLKAVGTYFSALSEKYNFLAMENENFSPQYHERVPGSSATGRTIREMQGFLVVHKDTNQVVRTGMVLT